MQFEVTENYSPPVSFLNFGFRPHDSSSLRLDRVDLKLIIRTYAGHLTFTLPPTRNVRDDDNLLMTLPIVQNEGSVHSTKSAAA